MVLLKHTLPDGSWHYDWLLATAGDAEGNGAMSLLAFRVFVEINMPSAAAFVAQRLDEHRAVYLTFEGEIEGNRGRIERLAIGTCRIDVKTDSILAGGIDWGHGMRWFDALATNQHWRVRVLATDRPLALRQKGFLRR